MSPFETIGVSDRQNDPVDILDEVPISIVDDQFLDGPQAGGERHPLTSVEKAVDVDDWFGSALRINEINRENFHLLSSERLTFILPMCKIEQDVTNPEDKYLNSFVGCHFGRK